MTLGPTPSATGSNRCLDGTNPIRVRNSSESWRKNASGACWNWKGGVNAIELWAVNCEL